MFISQFLLLTLLAGSPGDELWPHWAGPSRDFSTSVQLADWKKERPEELWRRDLGNGHAAIVADDQQLYTVYGTQKKETIVALDRETGETLWERTHAVSYAAHREDWDGPHATPTLVADRLITVSIDAVVRVLESDTGRLVWQRDLRRRDGVVLPQSGWAASPLHWQGRVLLPGLGGSAPGALALDIEDGTPLWSRHRFRSSHASPTLLVIDGVPQALFHGMDEIWSLDPATGDVLWSYGLRNGAADNVSFTPIWDATREQLILSHGYDDWGTRALSIGRSQGAWQVDQRWNNRRLRVDHGNLVIAGDVVIGSHKSQPGMLLGLDADTGELAWRRRMPKVNSLSAPEGVVLVLDEDGILHRAAPTLDSPGFGRRVAMLRGNAWTVPTRIGPLLYARDRFEIVAYRLP